MASVNSISAPAGGGSRVTRTPTPSRAFPILSLAPPLHACARPPQNPIFGQVVGILTRKDVLPVRIVLA